MKRLMTTAAALLSPLVAFFATAAEPTGPIEGEYEVTVEEGATETWSGEIAGTGAIVKKGAGTLVFAHADNTFSGGLRVEAGTVQATATGAFGTGGITNVAKTSQIVFSAPNGTFPNELYQSVTSSGDDDASAPIRFTENTTLMGDIIGGPGAALTLRNIRKGSGSDNPAGSFVQYFGRISKAAGTTFHVAAYGTNDYHGAVIAPVSSDASPSGEMYPGTASSARGLMRLWSSENEIGRLYLRSSALECMGENVISNTAFLWDYAVSGVTKFGYPASSINMNGWSQRIRSLESTWADDRSSGADVTAKGASAFFSSAPATLTILGHSQTGGGSSANAKWARACLTATRIEDEITLVLDAQEFPNFVQTFTNRAHTTCGDLVVSNGTLRLAGTTTFANVPRIRVARHGTLEFAGSNPRPFASLRKLEVEGRFVTAPGSALGIPDFTVDLALGSGAELYLGENETLVVQSLTVDGEPVLSARYDSSSLPQLKQGTLLVSTALPSARWTGLGGADTAIGTLANWDQADVDLVAGGQDLFFAEGGEVATVSGSVWLKTLSLGAAPGTDGFALLKGGESAEIRLRYGPLAIAGNAQEPHEYRFEMPLALPATNRFELTLPDRDVVRLDGGLKAEDCSVDLVGNGTLCLAGTNVLSGALTRSGQALTNLICVTGLLATPGHVDQGVAALGDGKSIQLTSLSSSKAATLQGLFVSNAVIEKPIVHTAATGTFVLHAAAGTTNVFKGGIVQAEDQYSGISMQKDSVVRMSGGYVANMASFRPTGAGHLIFDDQPLVNIGSLCFNPNGDIRVTFDNTNNVVRYLTCGDGNGESAVIEFARSETLTTPSGKFTILLPGLHFTSPSFTHYTKAAKVCAMEFNATTQHVTAVAGSRFATLRGDVGSRLVLTGEQGVDYTISSSRTELPAARNYLAAAVEGGLSLAQEGSGRLTVTNMLSGTSGSLEVASGEVHFASDAAWTNVSEIVVSGTGALSYDACAKTANGLTFNRKAMWRLSGAGRVAIPAGAKLKARQSLVDVPFGKYTYATAPAALKAHLAETTGTVEITGDGVMIIVR